jgi:hypothetical protein
MKHPLSTLPFVLAGVLVASLAAAEGAHVPATPHGPEHPAAAPAKAAPAPKAPAAPRVAPAPKAGPKLAPKIVVGAKHTGHAEKAAEQDRAPIPGVPFIRADSSDPGIKITVDPTKARVRVSGTAKGPRLVDYMGRTTQDEDKESYGVARGVGFDVDKFEMPDFSKDPDYSNKNKWFFAHSPSVNTSRGDSAMLVAKRLAAKLSEGGYYDAKVTEDAEGAVIEITKL